MAEANNVANEEKQLAARAELLQAERAAAAAEEEFVATFKKLYPTKQIPKLADLRRIIYDPVSTNRNIKMAKSEIVYFSNTNEDITKGCAVLTAWSKLELLSVK